MLSALPPLMFTAALGDCVPCFKINPLSSSNPSPRPCPANWSPYSSFSFLCSILYNFYRVFSPSDSLLSNLRWLSRYDQKVSSLRLSYRDVGSLLACFLDHISTPSFPPAFHCKCSSHLDFPFFLFLIVFSLDSSVSQICAFFHGIPCYNISSTCTPSSA